MGCINRNPGSLFSNFVNFSVSFSIIAAIFLPFLGPVLLCLIRTDMLDVSHSSSVTYCAKNMYCGSLANLPSTFISLPLKYFGGLLTSDRLGVLRQILFNRRWHLLSRVSLLDQLLRMEVMMEMMITI